MGILGLGPYIGNFEVEVTEFRPYARWLSEVLGYDDLFIFTHKNRFFLYDWIREENKIPISDLISFDETNQIDHRNKNISKNEYLKMRKIFKKEIMERSYYERQNILLHNIGYSRSSIPIPFYNKIFSSIELECETNNHVFFIPSKNDAFNRAIIRNLEKVKDVIVYQDEIDKSTKYLYNIKNMLSSKFVVGELSFWTLLCNVQHIPVLSWGTSVGPYKKGGVLNFGNKNSTIFFDTGRIEVILEMLDYFMRGLELERRDNAIK